MAKLYFRYGPVSSAKTMNLLAVAYNYEQQGKKAVLLKPAMDNRFGENQVKSRAGFERKADILLKNDTILDFSSFEGVDCLLVDEAQFLSDSVVEQLRDITNELNIPVICYGLRADFRTRLFDGAKRLFELADRIEEIKTTCAYCNKKGIINLKLQGGKPTVDGPSIELGTEEKYLPVCYPCYRKKTSNL